MQGWQRYCRKYHEASHSGWPCPWCAETEDQQRQRSIYMLAVRAKQTRERNAYAVFHNAFSVCVKEER